MIKKPIRGWAGPWLASDGSGVERLTTNPGTFDGYASWSPDGDKIAFTSHRDSNLEI